MRWYLKPDERLPTPPLVEGDQRGPVLIGTIVWAVLAVVAWLRYDALEDDGRGWWAWVPVSGVVLGLLGLLVVHRRQRRLAAGRAAGPAGAEQP